MRVRMVVTDVGQMKSGVCIAGYTEPDGVSIRPVLASGGGIPWALLRSATNAAVEPFSLLEIDLRYAAPAAPHTEDFVIDGAGNIQIVGSLSGLEAQDLLRRLSVANASELFGAEIINQSMVRPGAGSRSIGTMTIPRINYVDIGLNPYGRQLYRVTFNDGAHTLYRLRVTDVAFRQFADQVRNRIEDDQRAAMWLKDRLNSSEGIFLRIGLSRKYDPTGGENMNCYLMVTGIYTFPNYLEQRWSAYYPAN